MCNNNPSNSYNQTRTWWFEVNLINISMFSRYHQLVVQGINAFSLMYWRLLPSNMAAVIGSINITGSENEPWLEVTLAVQRAVHSKHIPNHGIHTTISTHLLRLGLSKQHLRSYASFMLLAHWETMPRVPWPDF